MSIDIMSLVDTSLSPGAEAHDEVAIQSFSYSERPRVAGKFLSIGNEKFWIRGVTYGTFSPDTHGCQYPPLEQVDQDFSAMAANGINAVRTYTTPPRWLLDTAQRHGLRVMVGLAWEQHITFLDDRKRIKRIEERIREAVKACAGHAAVLCYTIGNEIPPSIVRWYGRRRIERFLNRLYDIAKKEDPDALVTYVNFPTTEYLQLPFLDFLCFNVYLETRECLEAYLARLQNLAGERPLVMAEIGLDSRCNGEEAQAASLEWQVRTAFAAGCAGAFVFAWTDEWYRGGYPIEDWDFGLTTRDRSPKPALMAICKAYTDVPFPLDIHWPRISVVVCSFNGARTIRDTLAGLQALDYPDYEVIVVNDGSTDDTATIASEYYVRLISTENRGLSNARNTGWQAAGGEIVAYIDDDAYPDPHWLKYLAATFLTTSYVGVGGPNIAPPGDGPIAECVANAPGGPIHVLISDREAEHIPGCNMAFYKTTLQAIGGFDPRYRAAGDDVDVCWRLQERGWKIGFHPAAVNWHHRRNSVSLYWKQQQGYGKAEALLEEKWPERYNAAGHLDWAGRLYGKGLTKSLGAGRWQIYQGVWGTALFQSLYQPAPGMLLSLPLMPEWYWVIGFFALLLLVSLSWTSLLPVAGVLLIIAIALPVLQALLSATHASFPYPSHSFGKRLKLQALTAFLHLIQPLARLIGRSRFGLTPWRRRGTLNFAFPWPRTATIWSERWQSAETRLEAFEAMLRKQGAVVRRGNDYDSWDLEIRGGSLGTVRVRMAVEEHGAGKQLLRLRSWPRFSPLALMLACLFAGLSVATVMDRAWFASGSLGLLAALLTTWTFEDCAMAGASWLRALRDPDIVARYNAPRFSWGLLRRRILKPALWR